MKATYIGDLESANWTVGKEYEAKYSPVKGFMSIHDDNGAEHWFRLGSTLFKWAKK